MQYAELCAKVGAILPSATFGEDLQGQLVIYTDFRVDADGKLRPLPPYEEPFTVQPEGGGHRVDGGPSLLH